MPINKRVKKADIIREAGMIKPTTRIIGRSNNSTSVVRRYIHSPTAPRLKRINTMITRS